MTSEADGDAKGQIVIQLVGCGLSEVGKMKAM